MCERRVPCQFVQLCLLEMCISLYIYQERRKQFKIGQAIKNFSLAPLANFLSTITTCKASLWLADAS